MAIVKIGELLFVKIFINLLFQPFSQDILMPRPFLGYPHSRRIRGFGYRNYYSSGSSYSNGKKEWFFEILYFTFKIALQFNAHGNVGDTCNTFCQQHPSLTSICLLYTSPSPRDRG